MAWNLEAITMLRLPDLTICVVVTRNDLNIAWPIISVLKCQCFSPLPAGITYNSNTFLYNELLKQHYFVFYHLIFPSTLI